jgi:EmrB/QacA subfamily drug resistance transporter
MSGKATAKAAGPEPESVPLGAAALRSQRGPVLVAMLLSTGLVALDVTILATAVPSIVLQLGSFSQLPWLFSVYLLAQAVTVPLYGKLADLRGRRPVLLWGIAVFGVGSVLCGVAWSMPALIVFRGVQGIGAGAVGPMTVTVVGDLYAVEERGRVQGYIASVWAVASVVGPTLGGLFAQYLSWRWIFFVNIPIALCAAWLLLRGFHEKVLVRAHTFDVAGAVLLTLGCSSLILGLLEGGVAWAWKSPISVAMFVLGTALVSTFLVVEARAREPVLPLWVFRPRVLVGGNLAAAGVATILIVLSSYVPTYVQGVLGTGAVVAGFGLATLTIGWPIAANFSGRLYMRLGFRDAALIGSVVVIVGTVLFAMLGQGSHVWEVAAACFVVGAGLSLTNVPTLVAVQSVVDWQQRGVVTATNMFSRAIGSAVGVAVFGAIANAAYQATTTQLGGPGDVHHPDAIYDATHRVFVFLVVVAVFLMACVLIVPRRVLAWRENRDSMSSPQPSD